MIFLYIPGIIIFLYMVYCIFPTYYYKWFKKPCMSSGRDTKQILLSFDDGPDPRYTEALLEVLAGNNVHAVFFVVAKKAAENPQIISEIIKGGHEIGLHSLEHISACRKGWRYFKRDFKESLAILEDLGCRICYYRPPWGHINMATIYYACKYHLHLLLWTVMAQDWEDTSTSQRVLQRLMTRTKNGSVVCLHDSGEGTGGKEGAPLTTIEALSVFLPAMIKDGYKFVLPKEYNNE